ncbi:universal stress protein [Humisphaera borealis]|uniref:Universal stress protein n=1 Tax=Humisphaera borealis TaxID=2807512 RepID=A0A7M2X1N4_9BACT|nr:universal stress protein [Humisphaera borealis]QOV91666.1 universal stress protein [Humisphaera borealis]
MKVLLAYDGSACGDVAIADLARAGLAAGSQVRVVTIADVYLPSETDVAATPASHLPEVEESRTLAHKAMDFAAELARSGEAAVRTLNATWHVSHEVLADSPAWAIIKLADVWEPDLIVVGSQGKSAMQRLALGSVSAKVVAHAACSVRIARSGPAGRAGLGADAPVRIVLGIDGSVGSATAISALAQRKWPTGSQVLVLFILDLRTVTSILSSAMGTGVDVRKQAQQTAERACQELRAAGLNAKPKVIDGDVRELLATETGHWQADCIFVGAKGMSMIERFLLGSVSSAIASRAPCTVEVVRISS